MFQDSIVDNLKVLLDQLENKRISVDEISLMSRIVEEKPERGGIVDVLVGFRMRLVAFGVQSHLR